MNEYFLMLMSFFAWLNDQKPKNSAGRYFMFCIMAKLPVTDKVRFKQMLLKLTFSRYQEYAVFLRKFGKLRHRLLPVGGCLQL